MDIEEPSVDAEEVQDEVYTFDNLINGKPMTAVLKADYVKKGWRIDQSVPSSN